MDGNAKFAEVKDTVAMYSIDTRSRRILKEQLRLFAFNDSSLASQDAMLAIQQELSKRERLTALLEGELNFHGEDSGYASHDLHAFAAKFPPQLPRAFIRGLTVPGDVVLDPMMGSGTTVVEALLEGRHGIGLDIDPLALRLSKAKTTPLNTDILRDAGYRVLAQANTLLSDGTAIAQSIAAQFDDQTKAFVDYWFLPATQRELMALALPLRGIVDPSVRRFLELTFSSIIVTKSGGVSRARDLAHSRPHLDDTKVPKNALEQFSLRLRKNLASMAQLRTNGVMVTPLAGDARCMPLADNSVDLVVTSPPYANAIDYMRAHKFSLVWLGESIADLSKLRAEYIGSERVGQVRYAALPARPEEIIQQLAGCDNSKATVLRKYFVEMQAVLAETHRVLRADSAAIVVVGTSMMRNIDIQTHHCLADIATALGFDVVGVVQRVLDRNKRMMPARFGKKTDSMIEQRMHEEYVVGLLKPSPPPR
jgi:DNA modification methylase